MYELEDMEGRSEEPVMFGARMFSVLGDVWWTPLMMLGALIILVGMYIYMHRDARRRSLEDDQIGIKAVLHVLLMLATAQIALGLIDVFHFVLAKAGGDSRKVMSGAQIKAAVGPLLSGMAIFGLAFGLLQKTNYRAFTKASRLALGFVGAQYLVWATLTLSSLVTGVLTKVPWLLASRNLATLAITAPIGLIGVMLLGRLSGWSRGMALPGTPPAPPPGYGYPPPAGHGGYAPPGQPD